MIRDNTDRFIVEHYRSMNQPEMADKLGIDKSTVSRRVARLKSEGDINAAVDEAARKEAIEARQRLQKCAMSRTDRLEALAELRDALHDEIAQSGGASLARVSSEYRRTIEEMETISIELDLSARTSNKLSMLKALRLKAAVSGMFPSVDYDTAMQIVDEVLSYLTQLGVIDYRPANKEDE